MGSSTLSFRRSPVAEQLARTLASAIHAGQFSPGSRLPSTREIASRYAVSPNTVYDALRELEAMKLIEVKPRQGGFVRHRQGELPDMPRDGKRGSAQPRQVALIGSLAQTPEKLESYTDRIRRTAEGELIDAGYRLTLLSARNGTDAAVRAVANDIERLAGDLAGAILFLHYLNEPICNALDARGIPWVTLNRTHQYSDHNFVSADNVGGGRLVGRCFARLGFERVVLLGMDVNVSELTQAEATGFLQAYLQLGLPLRGIEYVPVGNDYRDAIAYERMRAYLAGNSAPQGIFAMGDLMAIGAIRACRAAGLRVPEDVSVISDTGMTLAEHADPPLTLVRQPMGRMGRELAHMLLEMIRAGARRRPGRYIPTTFVFRQSTRVPPDIQRELNAAAELHTTTLQGVFAAG